MPLAHTRLLSVDPALTCLFPEHGLRRGSVLSVSGTAGATSLLLALVTGAMAEGSWAAVVGTAALGLEAAAALGVWLDRLVVVPAPGARWPEVVGALLDALDLVVVNAPGRCRPADARRLAARARERGAVLVVAQHQSGTRSATWWPEGADLQVEVVSSSWGGLAMGDGALARRQVVARSLGRRGGARERVAHLWLPAADGRLRPVDGGSGTGAGRADPPAVDAVAG